MKNQITLLWPGECSKLPSVTDAGLLGWINGATGETHYGMLSEEKEHSVYIYCINDVTLRCLIVEMLNKRTACGELEFERKAKMVIECSDILPPALLILYKRAQIVKSSRGIEFHFNLEGNEDLPDVMPCPFCGCAAHFDEDVYSIGKLHLQCDSGDPRSCGEALIWETKTDNGDIDEPK